MRLSINSPSAQINARNIIGNTFDLESYKVQRIMVFFPSPYGLSKSVNRILKGQILTLRL